MIRKFGLYAILLSTIAGLFSGCASDSSTQSSTPQAAVPGERRDGGEVTPGMGPGGASANVRF